MKLSRTRTLICLAIAAVVATGCSASTSSSSPPATTRPTTRPMTTTSTTSTSAPSTTPLNVVATPSLKADLTAAFVGHQEIPTQDIAGTSPGSVYVASVPATGTSWALATFVPTSTASQQTLVGLQDGGGMGIFTKSAGGSWTMVASGSFPFCPSQTPIPAAVRALWGLTDPSGCSPQG